MNLDVQTRRLGLDSLTAVLLMGGAAALGGCQTGRTYVLSPAVEKVTVTGAAIREGESNATLAADEKAHFEQMLRRRLGEGAMGAIGEGEDLTIEYRVVLHEPGNGATRVGATLVSLTGVPTGSLGNGNLGIDTIFKDRQGREVARILADGPIDGPGGSTKGGLSTAASSIAKYAKETFGTARMAGAR